MLTRIQKHLLWHEMVFISSIDLSSVEIELPGGWLLVLPFSWFYLSLFYGIFLHTQRFSPSPLPLLNSRRSSASYECIFFPHFFSRHMGRNSARNCRWFTNVRSLHHFRSVEFSLFSRQSSSSKFHSIIKSSSIVFEPSSLPR